MILTIPWLHAFRRLCAEKVRSPHGYLVNRLTRTAQALGWRIYNLQMADIREPGLQKLAETAKPSMSLQAAKLAIVELREAGLLAWDTRKVPGQPRNRPNLYRLVLGTAKEGVFRFLKNSRLKIRRKSAPARLPPPDTLTADEFAALEASIVRIAEAMARGELRDTGPNLAAGQVGYYWPSPRRFFGAPTLTG